jgi:hypothetical protein
MIEPILMLLLVSLHGDLLGFGKVTVAILKSLQSRENLAE